MLLVGRIILVSITSIEHLTDYETICQVDDIQDTYTVLKQCSDATETDKFIKRRLKVVESHHKVLEFCDIYIQV